MKKRVVRNAGAFLRKLLVISCLCFTLPAVAQVPAAAQDDNVPAGWRSGGWEFFEVNHDFGGSPFFGTFYFEHDNLQYRYFDCWYTRTTLGVKLLPWLKADLAYDFLQEPSYHTHKLLLDLTGTLKQGNLKVAVRERYVHSWTPALGTEGNLLRSRLKVQYAIPESRFSPYLAVEVFTWGDTWKRTRHYVALDYDITSWMQFEAYYLYYAHNGLPAQHIMGIGVNFYL